jgi:hypothetical protein
MLSSDIEGSTSLLSRLGGRYVEALDLQRSAWQRWGGVEMGTEGDSCQPVTQAPAEPITVSPGSRNLAVISRSQELA